MSYFYDPHLNPSFELTKREISKSITNLQQKLRKRKAMEMQLLQEDLKYHSKIKPPIYYQQQPIYPIESRQQQGYWDYMQRLEILRKQNQAYNRIPEEYQLSPKRLDYIDPLEQDEILIRKYQDGTKVRQYNNQLDSIARRKSHSNLYDYKMVHRPISKLDSIVNLKYSEIYKQNSPLHQQFKTASGKKFQQNIDYRSPYQNLIETKPVERKSSQRKLPVKRELLIEYDDNNINSNKKQQDNKIGNSVQKLNVKKYLQKNYQRQKQQYRQTPKKIDNIQQDYKINKSKNKSPYGQLQSAISKKSMEVQKISQRRKYQSINQLNKQDLLKKIQNRLKLSSVIFGDSKFRNNKYQINHLVMTYQNQCRTRKDIKEKINGYQGVIKKYGLVK